MAKKAELKTLTLRPVDLMKIAVHALKEGKRPEFKAILDRFAGLAKKAQVVNAAAGLLDVPSLRALAKHGADFNGSHRNYRALHCAIQGEPHPDRKSDDAARVKCVKALLELGADPLQRGGWPAMPALQIAAASRERECIAAILEHGTEVDAFAAAALGRKPIVRKALDEDESFARAKDPSSLTALHYACASRLHDDEPTARALREIASLLLDNGADPNARAKSWSHEVDAAYFAISAKHFLLAEVLLKRGSNPNEALPAALWNTGDQFPLYAELCIRHGAHADRSSHEGKPLLNQLVRWGQVKPALWLMERGADPNLTDDRGWTAVHQAASRGNARMFSAALKAGGDPDLEAKDGTTARKLARAKRLDVE